MVNKKKMFVIVCACMLILAQGTMVLATTVRAAATQGQTSSNSSDFGGGSIYVSASCYGKTASGSASASGAYDRVDGCTYEFFDMDGYHETGRLVNYSIYQSSKSWAQTNWFSNKEHAYSGVTY